MVRGECVVGVFLCASYTDAHGCVLRECAGIVDVPFLWLGASVSVMFVTDFLPRVCGRCGCEVGILEDDGQRVCLMAAAAVCEFCVGDDGVRLIGCRGDYPAVGTVVVDFSWVYAYGEREGCLQGEDATIVAVRYLAFIGGDDGCTGVYFFVDVLYGECAKIVDGLQDIPAITAVFHMVQSAVLRGCVGVEGEVEE